jgi:PKD repeat protein
MVSRNRKQFVYLCLVLAIVGAVVVGIVGSPGAEDNSASVVYDSAGNSWGSYQGETNGDPKQTDVALKLRRNSPPNQPSHASPANGATGISLAPGLQSSAFSDPDARDTHAASQWQITSVSHNYSSSVYDSRRDTLNLTGITVPLGTLQAAKTYYWHVRHQDSRRVWSSWSAETSFTTVSATNESPSQPSNSLPANGATGISLTPALQSSSFDDSDDDDTHAASQWQITSISHNYSSSVYDSGRDTLNLTGITVPLGTLQAAKTYYWHVRHQDSHGVWSSWSAETLFSTASLQPTVTGVSPSQGIQGQTLNVTITGTNFTGATGVSFDPKITVNSFAVNDSTRITAVVTISAAAVPGLSSVSVTAPKGAGTLINGFTVYALPRADFSASATQVATGQTLSFISGSLWGIPPLTYAWDFDDDGAIDSTNQNPTYSYAVDGTYTVSLKVTDSMGNSDTETKTGYVTVSKAIEPHDITPQDATAVTTTNGQIAVTFPADAVTVYATAAIRQISPSSVADAPEGFKVGSSCFTIEAADARGNAIANFPRLVTITVKYSDEDLAVAGDDPGNLFLAYYNENTGKWNTRETTLNRADGSLSATTTHFSTWAILAKSPSRGLATWIQIVMGVAIALGLLGIVARKCISIEVERRDRVP